MAAAVTTLRHFASLRCDGKWRLVNQSRRLVSMSGRLNPDVSNRYVAERSLNVANDIKVAIKLT